MFENRGEGQAIVVGSCQRFFDLHSGGDEIGGDVDFIMAQDAGSGEEIGEFAASAGTDVRLCDWRAGAGAGGSVVIWRMRACDGRFEVSDVDAMRRVIVGVGIAKLFNKGDGGTGFDVGTRDVIRSDNAIFSAGLDSHVTDCHAFFDGHGVDTSTTEFHGAVGGAIDADFTDNAEDDVFRHEIVGECAIEDEAHGGRDFEEDFAGAEDEAGVGVTDASGELTEGARGASVGVCAEEDFTGARVTFFRKSDVTDAFVVGRSGVVEVLDTVLLTEGAENFDVAAADFVLGENIVVGDDDNFVNVEDLGVGAKFTFEDTDGTRATDVVRHEDIHGYPDIVAWGDSSLARVAGKDFFSDGHSHACAR